MKDAHTGTQKRAKRVSDEEERGEEREDVMEEWRVRGEKRKDEERTTMRSTKDAKMKAK